MWKLKDEETASLFTCEMAARNYDVTKADDVQKKWLLMKEIWLKGSKQVYEVCHKAWRKSKSAEDKHTLDVAKKENLIFRVNPAGRTAS